MFVCVYVYVCSYVFVSICVYVYMFVYVCECMCVCMCVYMCIRVETGSGHLGHPGHILSGSSVSDPLYKLSGSDPDSSLYHVR